jgi:hypothetical protein
MAALDFPATPSVNDEYTANGRTWKWNGETWRSLPLVGATGTTTLDFPATPDVDDFHTHEGWQWQWNGESWVSVGAVGSAVQSKHGNFACSTVLSATVELTFPFELKVLVIHGNDMETAINQSISTGGRWGWGVATSASSRYACTALDVDAAGTSDTYSSDRDDCIWFALNTGSGTFGRLDVQSWSYDSGGDETTVTLVMDEAFFQQCRLYYLGWGGESMEAAITTHTEPGATGDQGLTVGLADADGFLFLGAGRTAALPAEGAHAFLFFGACDTNGGSAVWCGSCEDNVGTMDTGRYPKSGQVIAMMPGDPNSVDARASFVSVSGTTLTLNWAERTSTRRYAVVSLKGLNVAVTAVTALANAATASISGLAFEPTSGLFFGDMQQEAVSDTPWAQFDVTMGAYSMTHSGAGGAVGSGLTTDGGCWGVRSSDNTAASTVVEGSRPSSDDIAASGPNDIQIDILTIQPDGLDFTIDDTHPGLFFLPCILVG